MKINIRRGSLYPEVKIEASNVIVDLGMLNKQEVIELRDELLNAANELMTVSEDM